MRWRLRIWLLLSSSLGLALWCWLGYQQGSGRSNFNRPEPASIAAGAPSLVPPPPSFRRSFAKVKPGPLGRFGYRLTNTTKTLEELMRSPRAVLLENALLDTG